MENLKEPRRGPIPQRKIRTRSKKNWEKWGTNKEGSLRRRVKIILKPGP